MKHLAAFCVLSFLCHNALCALPSGYELRAKIPGYKNESWFGKNKVNITFSASKFSQGTILDDSKKQVPCLVLNGEVENKSDDKIRTLIVDVIVKNKANNLEALRERIAIRLSVFKSEKATFAAKEDLRSSEIEKCFQRIKNVEWYVELVAAIPEKYWDDENLICEGYYKIKSEWKAD